MHLLERDHGHRIVSRDERWCLRFRLDATRFSAAILTSVIIVCRSLLLCFTPCSSLYSHKMPPRSTQRVRSTQSARRKAPATSQSSEGAQLEAARKSRRIARKVGEAGPSGWKHDEEGDERDLVPPSDVEEYEEWEQRRKGRRDRSSVDRPSPVSQDSLEVSSAAAAHHSVQRSVAEQGIAQTSKFSFTLVSGHVRGIVRLAPNFADDPSHRGPDAQMGRRVRRYSAADQACEGISSRQLARGRSNRRRGRGRVLASACIVWAVPGPLPASELERAITSTETRHANCRCDAGSSPTASA